MRRWKNFWTVCRRSIAPSSRGLISKLKEHGTTLPFPYSSQVDGRLRELRTGFGKTRLRILYFGDANQMDKVNRMANRMDRYYKQQMQDPEIRDLVEKELADLELGITIAKLREQENLNQTQLAARAGMNASKISLIETSARNVTLSTLARVAHALNTRIKIEFVPVKAKKRGRTKSKPPHP
jgi:hypothetical protein